MSAFSFRVGLVFEWGGTQYRIEKLLPNEQVVSDLVSRNRRDGDTRDEIVQLRQCFSFHMKCRPTTCVG